MADVLSELKVMFAMGPIDQQELPDTCLLIFPSPDKWNDFGHRTLFVYTLVNSSDIVASGMFRLGFTHTEKQPAAVIQEKLTFGRKSISAEELPPYFSLQLEMQSYRSLVGTLGTLDARALLVALHDLVACRQLRPVPDWVEMAVRTEVFNLSLIRTSDSFFAYFNAGSVLDGVAEENLSSVSKRLKLTFRLSSFKNDHSFDLRYDTSSLIPKRIAVLIGKNGVGKSQALSHLVRAALAGTDALTDGDKKRAMFSRIIALSTPGETENTFPPAPTEGAHARYVRVTAAPKEKADTLGQTLPEVILQLARSYATIGARSRWDIFVESVARLLPFESLRLIPPGGMPGADNALFAVDLRDLRYGGEQNSLQAASMVDRDGELWRQLETNFVPLSSGQLSFVRLAAQLALHIENGTLLLIDEPETHLHPNLVTDLVAMLNSILVASGSVAIIATHSAYLVREVPSSQVHIIREVQNGWIEVLQPRLRTFGADVGAISNFVFGDDVVNRLIADVEERAAIKFGDYSNWREQLKAELSTEALMHLDQRFKYKNESV